MHERSAFSVADLSLIRTNSWGESVNDLGMVGKPLDLGSSECLCSPFTGVHLDPAEYTFVHAVPAIPPNPAL